MEKINKSISGKDLKALSKELLNLKTKQGVKLAIAVNRNLKSINNLLSPIEEAFQEKLQAIPNLEKVESLQDAIQKEFAIKNENGEIIYGTNKYGQPTYRINSTKEYQEKIENLQKEYSEVFSAHKSINEEYQEEMNKEYDIELFCISEEYLPSDISGQDIELCVEFEIIN